jgi:hypothetical protein
MAADGTGETQITSAYPFVSGGPDSQPIPPRRPQYDFRGFLAPVDNPLVINVGKARRTYSLKWLLLDANGEHIRELSSMKTLEFKRVNCTATQPDATDVLEKTTSTSGLHYDSAAEQFVYGWRTPTTKGCYEAVLTLDDDSTHTALFDLSR